MGVAPETKLVVKRTFLEYIDNSHAHAKMRLRAQTEPGLVGGLVSDLSQLDTVNASIGNDYPVDMFNAGSDLASPELTFQAGPQACAWDHQQLFAGNYNPWMQCFVTSQWGECNVPFGMSMDYQLPANVMFDGDHLASVVSAGSKDLQVNGHPRRVKDPTLSVNNESNTTVMIRNLPTDYTREMLLELLDSEGFAGNYDFVYLPIDFNSQGGLGYAFVNLICPVEAQRFWQQFDGFSRWALPSDKVCSLNWSSPHQGLAPHIERYRNSPVMHQDVPDNFKPMIFVDGMRIQFPPPTRPLKAPRLRVRESKKSFQA
jgi:hypothetical protein